MESQLLLKCWNLHVYNLQSEVVRKLFWLGELPQASSKVSLLNPPSSNNKTNISNSYTFSYSIPLNSFDNLPFTFSSLPLAFLRPCRPHDCCDRQSAKFARRDLLQQLSDEPRDQYLQLRRRGYRTEGVMPLQQEQKR